MCVDVLMVTQEIAVKNQFVSRHVNMDTVADHNNAPVTEVTREVDVKHLYVTHLVSMAGGA